MRQIITNEEGEPIGYEDPSVYDDQLAHDPVEYDPYADDRLRLTCSNGHTIIAEDAGYDPDTDAYFCYVCEKEGLTHDKLTL